MFRKYLDTHYNVGLTHHELILTVNLSYFTYRIRTTCYSCSKYYTVYKNLDNKILTKVNDSVILILIAGILC